MWKTLKTARKSVDNQEICHVENVDGQRGINVKNMWNTHGKDRKK